MDTASLIASLDPCRNNLADLTASDVGAPKFSEAWHAQVFGLAMALARSGVFTWETWVATISAEIRAHPQRDDEKSEDAYYRQWEAALSTLLKAKKVANETELRDTAEDWRRSYLHTEHGKPIVFCRDLPKIDDHHHHHHHHDEGNLKRGPVSISAPNHSSK